jgi:hypothetical protein
MTHRGSLKLLLRATLCVVLIFTAASLALFVLPAPFEGQGGRDVVPQGITLAALLLLLPIILRVYLRWDVASLLAGLMLVEACILGLVGYYSGSWNLLSSFNLNWIASVNLFVGAPWLAGIAVGSALRWHAARRKTPDAGDRA